MDLQAQQVATSDPWDSAENPQLASPEYWGLCSIDMYYCILEKGTGKVRFDTNKHKLDARRTAIDIVVTPLPAMNSQFNAARSMVAESKEWAGMVLPSIRALGLQARELLGRYVHIRFKPTGKTYTNKNGEVKDNTTLEFVKVFPDEAACLADFMASKGEAPSNTQYSTTPAGDAPDKQRETAFQFLKVIIENAVKGQTDLTVIRASVAANIAVMPLVNKYFTVDSPETNQLIAEKLSK